METNKNIERLLEMIDHPEAYSEQEILDIINCDDETRETYHTLVKAHRAARHGAATPVDVDDAWRQFEQSHFSQPRPWHLWKRIAAVLAGIMLLSGIAWATAYTVKHIAEEKSAKQAEAATARPDESTTVGEAIVPVANDTATVDMEPVTFDNIPLDEMLDEIAAYYGMTVEFKNPQARNLRFHFVWNKSEGIEKVLEDLSHFESVEINRTTNELIVQ